MKLEKFAQLYIGSLYSKLDECDDNVVGYAGRYDIVTHIELDIQ